MAKSKNLTSEGTMVCIFNLSTCIYEDFDLQQVFEASPPKNLNFLVTSYVVFKNMFNKTVDFAQTGYFFVLLALLMHKNKNKTTIS